MVKRVKFDIYSNYFTILLFDKRLYSVLYKLCSMLTIKDYTFNKRTRRMEYLGKKEYFVNINNEYRFPIGFLTTAVYTMVYHGVNKEEMDYQRNICNPKSKLKVKMRKEYRPRDYQEACKDVVMQNTQNNFWLLDIRAGGGKFQGYSSLVKTIDGWKTMGEIKVGDKVASIDGTYVKVLEIHEQGVQRLFEVTFFDGRKTRCGGTHLWSIFNPERNFITVTTWQIMEYLESVKRRGCSKRVHVPLCEPIQNKEKKFVIHPYVLGCILGDGCITGKSVNLSVHNEYVLDRIESLLNYKHKLNRFYKPEGNRIKCVQRIVLDKDNLTFKEKKALVNEYKLELEKLGLMGCNAYNKFIPEKYLEASVEQRWELLRGLMDTDGYVDKPPIGRNGTRGKCGTPCYATSSYMLYKGIELLVRSLGGMASSYKKLPTYTHNGEKKYGKTSYVLRFRFKYPRLCVTRPSRLERLTETNQYSETLRLRIEDIKEVEPEKCRCITVQHPTGLYITDDYIVTHNSYSSVYISQNLNNKVFMLMLPKYIDKWVLEIPNYITINKEEIYVIQGSNSLEKLLKSKTHPYKIYIASIPTMLAYINSYEEDEDLLVKPTDLMEVLDIGTILSDETHQHLHALNKCLLYFSANTTICMSATFDTSNRELKKIYNYIIPDKKRISNMVEYVPYKIINAVGYTITNPKRVICTGSNGYSHIAFETSILRNSLFKNNYLKMVAYYVKRDYIDRRVDGDRCIVFATTKDMCNAITNYLKELHKELKISTYVAEDDYSTLITSDIAVTTLGSAGTGVDIPNLITAIQTICVTSIQANIQAIGRLRNIPGKQMVYTYLYSTSLSKHVAMHIERTNQIKYEATDYNIEEYRYPIANG